MRRRTFLVLLGLAAVPALVGGIAALVETDAEAIERLTGDCRTAFLAGKAGRILAFLAEDAEAEGAAGRGPLAPKVRPWVDRMKGRLQRIALDRRKIVVRGEDAEAEWTVTVHLRPGGEWPYPLVRMTARVGYRRGPSGWRIRKVGIFRR